MNEDLIKNVVPRYSRLSIISFILCFLSFFTYGIDFFIVALYTVPKATEPFLMLTPLLLSATSFIMGVVDLCKKNRKKLFSILAVVLAGIPLLFFVLILLIMLSFN